MMEWTDVSLMARAWMADIGNFGPTIHAEKRELKGRVADENGEVCKTYFTSDELRALSAACNEVADWLDKRADLAPTPSNRPAVAAKGPA